MKMRHGIFVVVVMLALLLPATVMAQEIPDAPLCYPQQIWDREVIGSFMLSHVVVPQDGQYTWSTVGVRQGLVEGTLLLSQIGWADVFMTMDVYTGLHPFWGFESARRYLEVVVVTPKGEVPLYDAQFVTNGWEGWYENQSSKYLTLYQPSEILFRSVGGEALIAFDAITLWVCPVDLDNRAYLPLAVRN